MQVSVENVSALERELTLKIPTQEVDDKVRERIREMSRTVRMHGFRPGRVPPQVIQQRYGAQVRNEVLSDVLGSNLQEALQEHDLQPVAQPQVDTTGVDEGDEITCVAKFEIMPEFPEIDVSAMEIERVTAEVGDADIDEMIENLRQQRRTFNPVERPAADDDFVLYEYSAELDGKRIPEEGSERAGAVIGSGHTFAELEALLKGRKEGDEVTEELTFPEDFRNTELAGKKANVSITVGEIKETSLPELNQEFFRQFGIDSDKIEDFREEVRNNLERELKAAIIARLKTEVADKLAAAHADLDVPQVLIDNEARALLQNRPHNEEQTPEEALDEVRPEALKRVKAALLMGQLARVHELSLDQERVGQLMAAIASTYQEPEKVIQAYSNDEQMRTAIHSRVMEEQVAEWVADHAKTTDKAMSFDEIMRPQA